MPDTNPNPGDSELVHAALAGDMGSLGTLIERHFGTVYAVALARLRDPEIAEDLAQEVFLRAQLHLDQLGPGGNFPAWVTRIARNLAVDWLRGGSRASRLLPMVHLEKLVTEMPDSSEKGARETMASQEETQALRRAIMNLAAEQREVVLLHFSEDLSQQEIAGRLGVSQATVSRQIQRALRSLRGTLEPALREVAPALRAPHGAVAKSLLVASAVGAMSVASKTALAAKATQEISALSQAPAAAMGVAASLEAAWSALILGGKSMATAKKITALIAVATVVGGGVGYHLTHSQRSDRDSPIMIAQVNTAAEMTAGPVVEGEPVTLRVDLSPGTRWTTTERTMTQRGAAMNQGSTVTTVTDHRVLDEQGQDAVQVESVVRDMTMADMNGQPLDTSNIGGRDVAAMMRSVRRLDTVDRLGRVISSEISGSQPTGQSADPVLQVLGSFDRSAITEVPDHAVRPGDSWRREIEVPGAEGVTAVCESTLAGLEETERGPVAAITRTITMDISAPLTFSSAMPSLPAGVQTTILRCHVVSRWESRLLIDEGRWLSHASEGEADASVRVRMDLPPGAGEAMVREETLHERRTTTIEVGL